ncbi:hypothetical protein IEQ34_007501 [Dendrobium chrysotoxum]|uniref:Uncharacterized protein n=1 Tax=Dendrobium chrysotoxum TaxID=161865 RepID=A0AAV7H559_DENCH|nr:hypothetical protein IEQ34_007501 [Dendrobium chrysotoxum]
MVFRLVITDRFLVDRPPPSSFHVLLFVDVLCFSIGSDRGRAEEVRSDGEGKDGVETDREHEEPAGDLLQAEERFAQEGIRALRSL